MVSALLLTVANNMANASSVHPRLGLESFRKFEPYFIEALKAFPETTEFKISGGLSPSTICARMRDSLLGYRLNQWPDASPEFRSLFEQHDGKFVMRLDPNMRVLFTARRMTGYAAAGAVPFSEVGGNIGKYIKTQTVIGTAKASEPRMMRINGTPTEDQILTLATLKATGQIEDPIVFTGDIRTERLLSLQSSHDIVFHFDETRDETIIM